MTQIVALLALMTLSFLTGLWILMWGWGLEPQSWGVIIGGFFVQMFIMCMIQAVNQEDK
jgi:hypothetical protein